MVDLGFLCFNVTSKIPADRIVLDQLKVQICSQNVPKVLIIQNDPFQSNVLYVTVCICSIQCSCHFNIQLGLINILLGSLIYNNNYDVFVDYILGQ